MAEPFVTFLYGFNWFVLLYFVVLSCFYAFLMVVSGFAVRSYNREYTLLEGTELSPSLIKPFSVLVPAYNEEDVIAESVRSFLNLQSAEYEIVVGNDGSTDGTLDRLIEAFDLEKARYDIVYKYPCAKMKTVYFSRTEPRLIVVDKENGGKADTLNACGNCARYPYAGAVDADSLLSVESMGKLMQRFSASPATIAVGGIVRVSNGCTVERGVIKKVAMPRRFLEQVQVVEYLRAFLFGRMGWSHLDILLIISGAFGVFRQDFLKRVGGWSRESLGEDMDLVIKLHRLIRRGKLPNRISFAPDPVCWTQVPNDLGSLSRQRDRWQRGLMQTLLGNFGMMFNPRYGKVGFIGMTYFFLFEMLSCLVEVIAYPLFLISWYLGIVNTPFFVLFLVVAIVWGLCLSFAAVFLEEMSYHRYGTWQDLLRMMRAAFLANFGYRQLHSLWRFKGFVKFLVNPRAGWGKISRQRYNSGMRAA